VAGAPEGGCDTGFCAGDVAADVVGSGRLWWWWCLSRSSWRGRVGRPPCEDVLGGVSLVNPGDEGACWRW
jgi:hypothetical protein